MIFSVVITAIGLLWTLSGLQTGVWFDVAPSGGFMLVFIGFFLTLLGASVVLSQWKAALRQRPESDRMSKKEQRMVLMILLAAIAGLVLMNYLLGTLIVLTLFLIGWFKMYGRFDWKKTLLFTVCVMTIIYAVFVLWLNVLFPTFLGLGII
jgi:uncharacterized membrane protein YeiB